MVVKWGKKKSLVYVLFWEEDLMIIIYLYEDTQR